MEKSEKWITNPDEILNEFASDKSRRLYFLIQLYLNINTLNKNHSEFYFNFTVLVCYLY